MTTEEKVALVVEVWEEHGLAPALSAVELPKSTWYYQQQQKVPFEEKYAHVRPLLEEIARQHPAYGIPRITPELRETYGQVINHKVVQKLLKLWDLALLRNTKAPQPSGIRQVIIAAGERVNLVAPLSEIKLFDVSYTDFTELPFAGGTRKAHLMPIIGHVCKVCYGWAVEERANTDLALEAWKQAKATFQTLDIPYVGMIMHHDQDSVYTGYAWTAQLLVEDQARLSYALNGAKDNTHMESFNGRFKTENRSLLLEAQTLKELRAVVDERINYYNTNRRHSALDNVPPLTYVERMRSILER